MQSWQLPEHIADILPNSARHLESAKEQLLALFRVHGYELVHPPLMEYSDSLLTHIDPGLSLKTIRVVDQLSGRQLGIRADITPQVARIDAHLLSANQGINRLCYAGSVLHARPEGFLTTREPFQVGAELYGYADVAADIELIDLMLKALKIGDIGETILSLGHIGIFRALAEAAKLDAAQTKQLLEILRDKDARAVAALVAQWPLEAQWVKAFAALPLLFGGSEVLAEARTALPALPAVEQALADLQAVVDAFPHEKLHIDLAELRFVEYHTGLLYSVYSAECHDAVARGGRYNGLGKHFGRARPATGFSFDLRLFAGRLPKQKRPDTVAVAAADLAAAHETVEQLRRDGITVAVDYGLPANSMQNSTRRLVCQDGVWQIIEN
jgi:ATP phosphoribosyltransferase regulatory subunit